ncbi:MAG: amidohydrolase, partial [Pseudomonadota bacterium]
MKHFRTAAASIALAFATTSVVATADDHSVDHAAIKTAVEADYDSYLAPLFVHFHENPELSFLENETASRMAQELRDA